MERRKEKHFKLMNKNILCVLVALCFVLNTCRMSQSEKNSSKVGTRLTQSKPEPAPSVGGEPIPPNHCRIIGTIVKIDSTVKSSVPTDPCSKAPCRAIVRIDSVLGYGAAFPRPLSTGDLLTIDFAFTLAPTKDLLPSMSKIYPGLHVNSQFAADVKAIQELSSQPVDQFSFILYDYEIR